MLQKLPIFLKNMDCIVLIKYDGERNFNKYTIRLLYNDPRKWGLGKDTDSPSSVMADIAEKEKEFPLEEVMELFSIVIDKFINSAIMKYGKQCIALVKLEEREKQIYYSFYIQTDEGTIRASSFICPEALKKVFNTSVNVNG